MSSQDNAGISIEIKSIGVIRNEMKEPSKPGSTTTTKSPSKTKTPTEKPTASVSPASTQSTDSSPR